MIPDLALQTAIVDGLRGLKRAPARIDQLFGNLPVPIRAQVRAFLEQTPIHFSHGYPMETPKLPHVILVLRREEESAPLLGQAVDPGPWAEEEILFRAEDAGRVRPPPRPEPGLADRLAGERAAHFPDEHVPLLYREGDLVERMGRVERLHYELQVRTQDYFATAFLHRAVKAILVAASAPALEAWGVHDLVLGGMDLEHTGQEYPHPVFARSLTLSFQYVFAVPVEHTALRAIAGEVAAAPPASEAPAATLQWQVTIA